MHDSELESSFEQNLVEHLKNAKLERPKTVGLESSYRCNLPFTGIVEDNEVLRHTFIKRYGKFIGEVAEKIQIQARECYHDIDIHHDFVQASVDSIETIAASILTGHPIYRPHLCQNMPPKGTLPPKFLMLYILFGVFKENVSTKPRLFGRLAVAVWEIDKNDPEKSNHLYLIDFE